MKAPKQSVEYGKSSNPAAHRCGVCEYYMPNPSNYNPTLTGKGECVLVDGDIEPMYGCKLYSVDLIVKANDPLNVTNGMGKS